ncbi:MAG: acetylornithine transaminase [Actinobacteria bacterium]|nr:acetylornithine transaminase [Actinomycetota bacterium]
MSLISRWPNALVNNYGTPPVALVRGHGARVWDENDREYIDLLAGIATNSLGHAHPALVKAVSEQVAVLGHVSNLVAHPQTVRLAERLLAVMDPDGGRGGRVFFCNSGAEANEAAFKLSRLTGRTKVIVGEGSFHGRTMGALALTSQPAKQDPFRPLPGDVVVVPYGDADALRAALDESVAAVFLESIQGEGGVVVPPTGYLSAARAACDEVGALLILDEVQTGMGRSGMWFAFQAEEVAPDVVTLAKGLGGGMPIGATIAFGKAAQLLQPGSHGSTFGGNPVCCAAANAVIDTIESDGLLAHVSWAGAFIRSEITSWNNPHIRTVRGEGLLLGVVLCEPIAREVEAAARQHGVLVNAAQPDVIRLAPPLVITEAEIREGLASLRAALAEAGGSS